MGGLSIKLFQLQIWKQVCAEEGAGSSNLRQLQAIWRGWLQMLLSIYRRGRLNILSRGKGSRLTSFHWFEPFIFEKLTKVNVQGWSWARGGWRQVKVSIVTGASGLLVFTKERQLFWLLLQGRFVDFRFVQSSQLALWWTGEVFFEAQLRKLAARLVSEDQLTFRQLAELAADIEIHGPSNKSLRHRGRVVPAMAYIARLRLSSHMTLLLNLESRLLAHIRPGWICHLIVAINLPR